MRRFFQPLSRGSAIGGQDNNNVNDMLIVQIRISDQSNIRRAFNPDGIVVDPALRRQIASVNKNLTVCLLFYLYGFFFEFVSCIDIKLEFIDMFMVWLDFIM
jgi:hypothetical protein